MASSYSELKFELIATGEQSGTWGNTTNENIGTAINEAIAGMASVTINGDTTLTWLNTVATQQARHYVLKLLSGTVVAPFNLVVPTIEKPYVVINTTGHTATVKTASGTGVPIPAGKSAAVYTDGTNVITLFNYVPTLTVDTLSISSAPLDIPSGGTGTAVISSGVVTSNGTTLSSVTQPAGDLVGTTATQTLTNKTVQLRVSTFVTYPLPTFNPDVNNHDMFVVLSQSSSLTFGSATGTPYNGQRVIFRITASSTIPISFSTGSGGYRAVGVILPSSLAIGYTLYVGCIWNSSISQWDVLAVNTGI